MGKGKPRWKRGRTEVRIFCRSVGPGGTTILMFRDGDDVKCVWTHENCPYLSAKVVADEDDAASDGHNVSRIPIAELRKLLEE